MKEYEIYLPTRTQSGELIDAAVIEKIKADLKETFGGYTHLSQKSEGAWKMGGVTFREEVTILRVLDDGTANFNMAAFKSVLERSLRQHTVLIISREVRML